jgi:hypothetical protein
VIYTKALLFTYPGVDPSYPDGFLMDHGCADFFANRSQPFLLERSRALELVRAAMAFRLRYDFNAQFALISRSLIASLSRYGDFYQSAFPDYYSMNAAFLCASRIVIDPSPKVVVGVTPKSYGYFHINAEEQEGRAFLDGAAPSAAVGTNINVGWLSAMTAIEEGVGREFGLEVDHRRYRFVQASYVYQRSRGGLGSHAEIAALDRELPLLERWTYRFGARAFALLSRLVPQRAGSAMGSMLGRLVGQIPPVDPTIVEGRYGDALEVCTQFASASSIRSTAPAGRE